MSADRWNEALEAAAKECANQKFVGFREIREVYSAACADCANAILALREDDQRGAAEQEAAGCAGTTEHSAQSAPHYSGGQPVAWTTALTLECARGVPLSFYVSPMNLWGKEGIPLYTHPGEQEKVEPVLPGPDHCDAADGYCLLCGGSQPMGGGCWRGLPLAATEKERSRG